MELLFALGLICLVFVAGALLGVYEAFVVQKLWTWFMVPVGLPHLDKVTIYGAMLIVSLFTIGLTVHISNDSNREEKKNYFVTSFLIRVISFSLVLGVGAAVNSWCR